MSEQNKQIARRFVEVFATGDTAVLDEVMAEDAVDHNPAPSATAGGRRAVVGAVETFRTWFPDLAIEVEREVVEGDYVVQYGWISGTNSGPMMGRPATGRLARFAYMDMHRTADGRIVESWHVEDIAGMLGQLGLLPA